MGSLLWREQTRSEGNRLRELRFMSPSASFLKARNKVFKATKALATLDSLAGMSEVFTALTQKAVEAASESQSPFRSTKYSHSQIFGYVIQIHREVDLIISDSWPKSVPTLFKFYV